jgi:hypothetical protein
MKVDAATLHPDVSGRPLDVTRTTAEEMAKELGLPVRYRTFPFVPGVHNLWLEVPLDDDWMAASRLAIVRGRPVVSELRIFPIEATVTKRPKGEWIGSLRGVEAVVPARGLTTKTLGRVRVHQHLQGLPALLDRYKKQGMTPEHVARWFKLAPPTPPTSGRGRKGLPDLFLARIARDYAAAVAAESPHPLQDVAKRARKPIVVVRGWVYKARQRGFLIGGAWGKPAGALSLGAEAYLRREAQTERRQDRRHARRKR